MQRPFQLAPPEIEEPQELWKARKQVIVLPDIDLQKARMIRQAIENFRRGEPVSLNLLTEIPRDHPIPPNPRNPMAYYSAPDF